MTKKIKTGILCLSLLSLTQCNLKNKERIHVDQITPSEINTEKLQVLIDDMAKPHEGTPSGVLDSYGWKDGPRIGYGNHPPEGWTAMIPWGQVYTDTVGNSAKNVRFQIRNLQTWYLSKKENNWIVWSKTSNIGGANYAEDFVDDLNVEADIRTEPTKGGGISSTLVEGYNFHFWSDDGRVSIDPNDIAGVWSSVESRLILDDPNGSNQIEDAKLMMGVGADYWLNLSTPWDQWKTNGDIIIGRFRYLTKDWQTFHAHTLTNEQILKTPPPIE